jgi:hypothetical protein
MILLKGYKPLVFENDSTLIISRKNKIFRYDILQNKKEFITELPHSFKKQMLYLNKLIYRITRGGIRNAALLDQVLYCTYEGKVWRIDLGDLPGKSVKPVFPFSQGTSSLNFTVVNDLFSQETGFQKGVYFGEYFSNPKMGNVTIYKIDIAGVVKSVFTFSQGTINHIHNIVLDKYRKCAWILTGDFENAASIWKAEDNFQKVSCIVKGNQKFRSCVAFPIKNGLLYATDSQFEQNEIRLLTVDDDQPHSSILFEINGPSIYGTTLHGNFIFTTATEPSSGIRVTWKELISRKPGPGIINNRSEVYLLTPSLKLYTLFSNEKDKWPYYLAQFGNILFPSGENLSSYLVTYSISNKINDLSTEIWAWKEVNELLNS